MFGSRRIKELESKLYEADDNVSKLTREKGDLEQRLTDASSRASEAEQSLSDANARIAELEDSQSRLDAVVAELDSGLKSEKDKHSDLEQDLSNTKNDNTAIQGRLDAANGRISELEKSLSSANSNIADLEQSLASANASISELEERVAQTDLEELKEQARVALVEVEGLRSMYEKKIQDFDNSLEDKQELYEKEDARQRYNMVKSIEDGRLANRDYINNTLKEFSQSFGYYLAQVKLLMDALGDVAVKTGETLFQGQEEKLLTSIGEGISAKVQDEADALDPEGVVLIKNAKEEYRPEPDSELSFEDSDFEK